MIDLTKFCQPPGEYRTRLQAPFSAGDWTYATNGHMAVRVARRDDVAETADEYAKAAVALERTFSSAGTFPWRPLDVVIPEVKLERCGICRGLARGVACSACKGEGSHRCDCKHCTASCEDCDGSGIARAPMDTPSDNLRACMVCDGRGTVRDTRHVFFGNGLALRAEYLRLVLSLPGPVFMAVRDDATPHKFFKTELAHAPQLFRFAGGMAAIAPVRCGTPPLPDDIDATGNVMAAEATHDKPTERAS